MAVNQGENIRDIRFNFSNSENEQELVSKDKDLFYHQTLSTPVGVAVHKAKGAYIYDEQGNSLLDLHGNGVHTIGYQHPNVVKAIQKQIEEECLFAPRRFTNEPSVDLATSIIKYSPEGLDRVLFCPGGSQAIEMAVMLAKQHSQKTKTISYYGSFHGAGFQAISLGADSHFRDGLGTLVPGAIHLEIPDYYRNPWGFEDQQQIDDAYIQQLKVQLEYNHDIAAFVSEPIFYNSNVPTKYYWEKVQALCKEHGIILIFDEIYTAFGRTGKFFASEHFVDPDIIVFGKGFGGGVVPYAGFVGRSEFNTISNRSIGHYTHEKNPFCASISKAVIDTVIEEDLVNRTAELGKYFKEALIDLQKDIECIGKVDGLGLNIGVDIITDKNSKKRDSVRAHAIMNYCLERGISFKLIQSNVLNLKPSLIISKSELNFIIETLKNAFLMAEKLNT